MESRSVRPWPLALALCAGGCGGPRTSEVLLYGSLGNAIRDTGFVCDEVVDAQEIEGTGDAWRVTCDETLVYLASVRPDGGICVEPVLHGDAAEAVAVSPEARCTEPTTP